MSVTIPGAVSLAIKCRDGVVLGNDKRVIMGYLVLSKTTKKTLPLTEDKRIAIASSGLIGDFQYLVRIMRAQANLYELREQHKISVKAMAKMVSNFLYNRKMAPIFTNVEIGGIDANGPAVYSMDAIGSLMPDNYSVSGSAATYALGILEAEYNEDLSVEEGVELAKKVIENAVKRDAMTGNGMDIIKISEAGTEEISIDFAEVGE